MLSIWNILIIFVLVKVWYHFKNRRKYELAKQFSGPKPLPIIGNVHLYFKIKPEDVIKFLIDNRKKYGKLFRFWIFNQLSMFSADPKDFEVVLSSTKHLSKNNLYDLLVPWLGTGLLISSGEKWFSRRKIITPTFHFKILEDFVEIFDRQSEILISKLQEKSDGEGFDIHPFITFCTLDIISESAMGTQIHSQTDKESDYSKALKEISNVLVTRFVKIWQRNNFLFNLFASNKKDHDNAIKSMHNFTEKIITSRRQVLEDRNKSGNTGEDEIDEFGRKRKLALLDVLLQATVEGKPLSNEDIREEVETFMFEGHDTTTSAISFILYCLSRNTQVQQKAYKEIQSVFGTDQNQPINYRQLQDLKYMELVIKESMRLYPPVPIIGRRFNEELNLNGKIIPAGTNFTLGIFVMMRDPEIFKNADQFIPERFNIETTIETINPYAFIPFSAGPRNCIGQKFAMLEMKTVLSKILCNFEIFPANPEPKLLMNLVLRSQNGVHIGLKQRQNINLIDKKLL